MSMLSYKQYKLLHENLDSVIGISKPTTLGIRSEAGQLWGMMSKKMGGDVPPGLGKKPPMGGKPPMGDDAADADMDMDDDHPHDDMGDDDDADADDMGDDDDADADDMGDEDGDEEGEGDEEGGEDMGAGDMGPMGAGSPPPGMGGPMAGPDMGGGLGGPPMGKKKPPMMMKKMGSMYMKKEAAADPQDSKMKGQNKKNAANDQKDDGKGTAQKKTTFVREDAECCSKCGKGMMKKSKKCCKMTKEQREFNDSLMRQAGSLKFQQDELGFWVPVKEDVLIPAQQAQEDNEPQPGEVGFAPQSKIGLVGNSFTEWAAHHASQVKKKKK